MAWPSVPSDKVWDFDEGETSGNVFFLDGPPLNQHVSTGPCMPDIQNLDLEVSPGTSQEGACAEFGEYWIPAPKPIEVPEDDGGPPLRKLFVGNLPYRVTDAKLRQFFCKFGKVVNAHVKREPAKRRHTFYGFVTFHKPESAWAALQAPWNNLMLFGYQLTVNKADPCHQPIELPDGTVQWLPGKRFYKDTGEPVLVDRQPLQLKKKRLKEGQEPECSLEEEVAVEVDEEDEGNPNRHLLAAMNDDCLLHIFSFLSLTDRIRVERVCKQWQAVARSMWRRMHTLDMRLLALPPHHLHSMGVLRSILLRCGDTLTSLSLAIYAHSRHRRSKFLPLVGELCPNLLELDATGVKLTRFGMLRLGMGCRKLRKVNLDMCSGVDERFLENLLRILPDLGSLSLAGWGDLTGRSLLRLPPATLRELNLNSCSNLRPNELLSAVKRLPHLESLSLTSCISLSNQHVKSLCEIVPQLRSLNMAQYFPRLKYTSLESIGILSNLRSLNLELNDLLTDSGLQAIVSGCKELANLNITGCRAYSPEHVVTSAGIKSLANLACLRELYMSYLANIEDDSLSAIAQKGILRKLECRGCPSLKGEGFIRMINLCPELELCDVSGCDFVRMSVVRTAATAVRLRNNNIGLRLIVGGTQISCEQVTAVEHEFPPLLNVLLIDLSVAHLRPDFVDGIYFEGFVDDEFSDADADELDLLEDLCEDMEFRVDLCDNHEDFVSNMIMWPPIIEIDPPILEIGIDYDLP